MLHSRFPFNPLRMKASLLLSAGLTLSFLPDLGAQVTDPAKPAAPAAGARLQLDAGGTEEEAPLKLDAPSDAPTPAAAPAAPQPPPNIQIPGLEKLSAAQRTAVMKDLGDVGTYIRGVRWQEALEKLTDVAKVTGPSHYVENLRGAVFTRMRDFKSAREHFTKAAELSKGIAGELFHPRFNLAEISFVEKDWDAARAGFQALIKEKATSDKGSLTLMKFKIMICDFQQKKTDEAEAILKTFDQYDDATPAFYFAQAAQCFVNEKKEEAAEWLDSAKKIYPAELNEVYNDSLVEVGWLETLGQ